MRSRVLGSVLFGFGVLALVFAGGLAFVVAPTAAQLPYDMELTQSVAEAPNARFLQIKDGKATIETGTARSTVTVQPDSQATAKLEGDLDGTALVWLAGQEVIRTDTNEVISAYSTSLAVDRKSGEAQDWKGQWLDTGSDREDIKYQGQVYKFPFGTEKKTYQYFDRDTLKAYPAQFVETEEIEGLETYKFTSQIQNGTQVLPEDRVQLLLGQLIPGATAGSVTYNNTRTLWVEPVTGQYIKVEEQQQKTLVASDGRSVELLNAVFTYTGDTSKRAAETASENKSKLNLVGLWGPLVLGIVGLILAIAGIVLVSRGPKSSGGAVQGGRHAAPAGGAASEQRTEEIATAGADKSDR
ncbi:DUF3068 domain-containing protein [Actinoplanes sp. NPDC051861]|uniref:DUF3068 domain-containing protein n=1 Tax=Actinoplanes sp. NPDC051861 TaxID=3155170 RepID=UPI0034260A1E